MALDHYVPQVHLRNFYDPNLGERMHGVNKTTLKYFPCSSESQCRLKDYSTTPYLDKPRAIEAFLRGVEPFYNGAVAAIQSGTVGVKDIYVIAGFVASIASCAPAAVRLVQAPVQNLANQMFERFAKTAKDLPKVPDALGGGTLSELIERGMISVEMDRLYPKAIATSSILETTTSFGNTKWDILDNRHEDSPFFTSDFPLAIEDTGPGKRLNRIVPLTPYLAIRIYPPEIIGEVDFDFPNFGYRRLQPSRDEVRRLNTLIVQCAETTVYYSRKPDWLISFVKRHSNAQLQNVLRIVQIGGAIHRLTHLSIGLRSDKDAQAPQTES